MIANYLYTLRSRGKNVLKNSVFQRRNDKKLTFHDGTANLLIDQHRVDDAATVFYGPVFEQLDEASLNIHLHIRGLHAIGENEGVVSLLCLRVCAWWRGETAIICAHGTLRLSP